MSKISQVIVLLILSVKLAWNPVTTYTNGAPLAQPPTYEIWRSTRSNLKGQIKVGESSSPNFTDNPAISGIPYFYYIKATVVNSGVKYASTKSNIIRIRT